MPKLFLFDLDGTLVDSAPDLIGALNLTLAEEGRAPVDYERHRADASRGARGLLAAGFGIDERHPDFLRLRSRFLELYGAIDPVKSRVFEGIVELFDALKARGALIGVVTNKTENLARPVLAKMGLAPYLATIVGSDRPSCAMKPSPTMFEAALADTGVAAYDALYAGDDPRDVTAAHAAGMPCAACAWGYLHSPVETWGADWIARKPADLLAWFDRERERRANSL